MKNIVLIGLSGSGKTTLGAQLAQNLNRPFVDTDALIEQETGQTIPQIFADHGEARFRALEAEAARRYETPQGVVLATGGGIVLDPQNRRSLRAGGFVVFIDRPVQDIASDIQIGHRPLLADGPHKLEQLDAQRRALYLASADYVLDNRRGLTEALALLGAAAVPLAHSGYAVIGDPIGHSLSPPLHKAAFAAQGIREDYTALHVPRGALPAFIAGVRASELRGFNVTLPHKQDILPLLDETDPEAALCGAVNTVVHRDGALHGYNTDMEGLHLSLQGAGHGFEGKRVLVLGAGGAARAAALKARLEGAQSLHIAARSPEKAETLARHIATATGCSAPTWGGWEADELRGRCQACDLLLNATPLGMTGFPESFGDLSFLAALPPAALVCDLIYTLPQTPLLAEAKKQGLATLNGLGMLIYQALLAQELFLGHPLDKALLYKTVQQELLQQRKDLAV